MFETAGIVKGFGLLDKKSEIQYNTVSFDRIPKGIPEPAEVLCGRLFHGMQG